MLRRPGVGARSATRLTYPLARQPARETRVREPRPSRVDSPIAGRSACWQALRASQDDLGRRKLPVRDSEFEVGACAPYLVCQLKRSHGLRTSSRCSHLAHRVRPVRQPSPRSAATRVLPDLQPTRCKVSCAATKVSEIFGISGLRRIERCSQPLFTAQRWVENTCRK